MNNQDQRPNNRHQRGGARGRPRRIEVCYLCRQPGHRAAQCPIRAAQAGQGAEAAAAAAEQADLDLGPRLAQARVREDPERDAERKREQEEEKRQKRRDDMYADMVAKASTMLLLKDPRDARDKAVVMRSISSIARQGALHELVGDVSDIVTRAYSVGLSRAVRQRVQQAVRDCYCEDVSAEEGLRRGLLDIDTPTMAETHWAARWLDPIGVLNLWESQPAKGVYEMLPLAAAVFGVARGLRISVMAYLEERVKRRPILQTLETLLPGLWTLFERISMWGCRRGYCMERNQYRFIREQSTGQKLVASIFIALIECWRRKSPDQLLIRIFSHFLLSIMPLWMSVFLHSMWNIYAKRANRLSLLEAAEDLTTAQPVLADVCCGDYPMKRVETQAAYQRQPGEPSCNVGFGCRRAWGVEGVIPTVFRNCIHNEAISMDGRVGKKLPAHQDAQTTRDIVKHWRDVFKIQVADLNAKIRRVGKPIPFLDWCRSFPPAKRDMFLKMKQDGIENPRKYASSFIKRELALKKVDDISFKDPRFIQGCPVEMSAMCGPSLRVLAKNVRQGLRPQHYTPEEVRDGHQIVYTCGLSAERVGQEFANSIELVESMCEPGEHVVFLEDDQSRFDLHLLEGPFNVLDQLYRMKLPKKVRRLLQRRISRGRTSCGTRYQIPWTMQSGWPDTSVGDTLVNAIMKRHIHGVGRKWISIICGDDSVTITTDKEIARLGGVNAIVKQYADFGMEVEASLTANPLDVGFCSGRFFPNGDTYVLMPKTGKLLGKLCWDTTDRNAEGQRAWLRGICATLEHYGQVDPILNSLCAGLSSSLGQGKVVASQRSEYKHWIDQRQTVNACDAYTYFDHHYQLSAREVDEVCSVLREAKFGELCSDRLVMELTAADV